MRNLILSELVESREVEVVERKGVGHPDTICDTLAETLSNNLSREYLHRFGRILHHNVDKALLCAGKAAPAFGGSSVTEPIRILLAGRAVTAVGKDVIPIDEISVEGSRRWLKLNLHALDVRRHIRIEAVVQQGSKEL
jgi:S-adenosylmethionine synthetase